MKYISHLLWLAWIETSVVSPALVLCKQWVEIRIGWRHTEICMIRVAPVFDLSTTRQLSSSNIQLRHQNYWRDIFRRTIISLRWFSPDPNIFTPSLKTLKFSSLSLIIIHLLKSLFWWPDQAITENGWWGRGSQWYVEQISPLSRTILANTDHILCIRIHKIINLLQNHLL